MDPEHARIFDVLLKCVCSVFQVAKFATIWGSTSPDLAKARKDNTHHEKSPAAFTPNNIKWVQIVAFQQFLLHDGLCCRKQLRENYAEAAKK